MAATTRDRSSSGFALLGVIILVTLLAVLSTTWMRHVLFENQASASSLSSGIARAAADSGLQFGQQSLAVGDSTGARTVPNGGRNASVQTALLANDRASIFVSATDDYGMGSTFLAEMARRKAPVTTDPESLPGLDSPTVDRLLGDASIPKYYYSGTQWIRDTEITGLVVIEEYATVFFDNVTLHGAIVSDDVLSHAGVGSYDPSSSPRAIVDGTLRIEPADFLPGVAVLMPDGSLTTWTSSSSIQIEGDIVVHTVNLQCQGATHGNIVSITSAVIGTEIVRLGQGRTPRPWSESLDMGDAWDTEYLAVLPRIHTVNDLPDITGFSFP